MQSILRTVLSKRIIITSFATLLILIPTFEIFSQVPGPATEVGTEVTFWDQRSFNGVQKLTFTQSDEAQSVNGQGINLQNRISSVTIPRGLRVKFYDGPRAEDAVSHTTYLYPGNYPWLGAWEDRIDFIEIEPIPLDEPIAYFYDEQQDVGTERLFLFQGLGIGDWTVDKLLGNDRFESVHVTGLIEVTPWEADNYLGRSQTYVDPDGIYPLVGFKADPYLLPAGVFDAVSSIQIRPRGGVFPGRIETLTPQNDSSDYFVNLNFRVAPPTQGLCLCPANIAFNRSVAVRSDQLLAPAQVAEPIINQADNLLASWEGNLQLAVGPNQKGLAIGFDYDSGFKEFLCLQSCGYAQASADLSISTTALKAPRLDSFRVLGSGEIELYWTKLSDVPDDMITAHVNRDGRRVATLEVGDSTYSTDDFPGPGPFEYTIEIEAFDQIATSNSLRLYAPIGIITGTVATRPGGLTGTITGVRNVSVCAVQENDLPGLMAGASYCDTTDLEGNYRIESIYFGEEATFRIEPGKEGHGFEPDFRNRTLNPQISIERDVDFTDTTSFTIAGRVVQPGKDTVCAVGGVEILINGAFLGDFTDADGNFVIVVPQAGNYSIQPRLADHTFQPAEYLLEIEADTAALQFNDLTTRTVEGYVRAGCAQYIGQAQVRFFGADNCLDTTITTTIDTGYFQVELPARKFDVEVIGIDLPAGSELDEGEVIGFLDKRSVNLTENDTTINYTYRQIPKIQITGLDGIACADLPYPILEQLEQVQLVIEVWEEIGVCAVDTGALIIMDRISVPNREVEVAIQNGVARYTLEATEPNIIAPYTKKLSITANVDGRLADEEIDVIVTGVRGREKTFATVTPMLPLMILRDPPGDLSSSYLSQNETFQSSTSFSSLSQNASKSWLKLKLGTKFELGFGYTTEVSVWGQIGGSATISATTRNNEEFTTSLTTGETFSTSNNEGVTGTEGDVFMGAAMNMIYALADEIIYNPATCTIDTDTTLIMGNDGFATTYIFTEDHIRNSLIPDLNKLVTLNQEANPDSVAFYQNQVTVWEQTLQRNEELKRKARFVENRSFSGNAPYESFTSASSTEKITIEYTDVIDTDVALEAGLEIAGVGFSGGSEVKFRMQTGASDSETNTAQLRTGYILNDGEQGDFFSVDIKTDPVYNTPVFDLVSGRSSCPFEPNTQPRDGVQLEAQDLVQTNVDPDGVAVYTLLLGNTSQSEEERTYQLSFNQSSNDGGATITIGGSEYQGPVSYPISAGNQREVVVTVKRGPLAFSHPNLEFSLASSCDPSINASILLSAYFQSDCSTINLQSDATEWVVSSEDAGILMLRLTDYEKDKLDRVSLQYRPVGSDEWFVSRILQPVDLSDQPGGTNVSLDFSELSDGPYQLRARLECNQGFVYSESFDGQIDRTPPQVFGEPEPIDDEYIRGEELSVTFDEPINCLLINADDIQMLRISDSTAIPLSVGCSGNKLLFRSEQDLFARVGEAYSIQLEGVEDQYGNRISEPVTWTFTIGGASGTDNRDFDGDGVEDEMDNCVLAANTVQRDLDGDGIGDACDEDLDGDGVGNSIDNAPFHPNPDQTDTDGNGIGDVAEPNGDGDGDGIANRVDNCLNNPNEAQSDIDGDGIGDACDDDIDNDGFLNSMDNCPTIPNYDQKDENGNQIGDICEGTVSVDNDLSLEYLTIYPNPTSGQFYLELEPSRAGRFSIDLYNSFGQRMQHSEVKLGQERTNLVFDVENLPSGMHYLVISDGRHALGRRIVLH